MPRSQKRLLKHLFQLDTDMLHMLSAHCMHDMSERYTSSTEGLSRSAPDISIVQECSFDPESGRVRSKAEDDSLNCSQSHFRTAPCVAHCSSTLGKELRLRILEMLLSLVTTTP